MDLFMALVAERVERVLVRCATDHGKEIKFLQRNGSRCDPRGRDGRSAIRTERGSLRRGVALWRSQPLPEQSLHFAELTLVGKF